MTKQAADILERNLLNAKQLQNICIFVKDLRGFKS